MNNNPLKIVKCSFGLMVICLAAGLSFSAPGAAAAEASSAPAAAPPRNYHFDKTISREVLENYLARSISMEGVFNGRGDLDDNIRMIKGIGAKYIGRSICLWNGEERFLRNIEREQELVAKALVCFPAFMSE